MELVAVVYVPAVFCKLGPPAHGRNFLCLPSINTITETNPVEHFVAMF